MLYSFILNREYYSPQIIFNGSGSDFFQAALALDIFPNRLKYTGFFSIKSGSNEPNTSAGSGSSALWIFIILICIWILGIHIGRLAFNAFKKIINNNAILRLLSRGVESSTISSILGSKKRFIGKLYDCSSALEEDIKQEKIVLSYSSLDKMATFMIKKAIILLVLYFLQFYCGLQGKEYYAKLN